jgi:Tol biopolymer transport system component
MTLRRAGVLGSALLAALVLAAPALAAFSGKNGKIAFTSYRDGGPDIYVMNSDGTAQTRLTAGWDPAWAPSGDQIAFVRYDPDGTYGLYKIDADGSDLVRLPPFGLVASSPTWSPDGTKISISFVPAESAGADIWLTNADGSGAHPLDVGVGYSLSWSPDGTRIAFVRDYDIYTVDLGNGTTKRLTTTGGDYPDWSPDGSKIAFSWAFDVYVMNADGTGVANLTNSPGRDEFGGFITYRDPMWSPDGTKIALAHRQAGDRFDDIFVMNAAGSNPANLSSNTSIDWQPSWQPLPGPKRSDYKNAAKFCEAERAFLGDAAFMAKYGRDGKGANAFGKCVSNK